MENQNETEVGKEDKQTAEETRTARLQRTKGGERMPVEDAVTAGLIRPRPSYQAQLDALNDDLKDLKKELKRQNNVISQISMIALDLERKK